MALPIVEQIAALLLARVEKVTADNGYQVTLNKVTRPRAFDVSIAHNEVQVVMVDEKDPPKIFAGSPPSKEHYQPFHIFCCSIPSANEDPDGEIETSLSTLVASVRKAIVTPETVGVDWAYFTTLATESEFGPTVFSQDESGSRYMATLELIVTYRTSELDDTTSRT